MLVARSYSYIPLTFESLDCTIKLVLEKNCRLVCSAACFVDLGFILIKRDLRTSSYKPDDKTRKIKVPYAYIYIQGVHKRMVQFQKLTRNLFLTLHGHNVHRQQRQLSRYQQFACHAYYRAVRPVSKMASQQEKAFSVLRFEVSRSVITAQRECRARFRTA
jgi:hypothetical protein